MKLWNNITVYDPFERAKQDRMGPYEAMLNRDDPSRLAIKAPERGGSNIGGFKVDNQIEEMMRVLLDRGIYGFRTKADICRAAVTHFVMDQLVPALGKDSGIRFEAYRAAIIAQSEENAIEYQEAMLKAAEAKYRLGVKYPSRVYLKKQAVGDLLKFISTYRNYDETEFDALKEMFGASEVLGAEFLEALHRPEDPVSKRIREAEEADFEAQAEHMREMERLGKDEALDALAREQEER